MPWWKRPFDILFSLFAIIVTMPFMLLIALIIKLTDRGPIFFLQERVGYRGKKFKVIKFRTMYLNNDKILEDYLKNNPKAKEEWEKYRGIK